MHNHKILGHDFVGGILLRTSDYNLAKSVANRLARKFRGAQVCIGLAAIESGIVYYVYSYSGGDIKGEITNLIRAESVYRVYAMTWEP